MQEAPSIQCPFCGKENDSPMLRIMTGQTRKKCEHQISSFLAGSPSDIAEYFGVDVAEWMPQDHASFEAFLKPMIHDVDRVLFAKDGDSGLQGAILTWMAEQG